MVSRFRGLWRTLTRTLRLPSKKSLNEKAMMLTKELSAREREIEEQTKQIEATNKIHEKELRRTYKLEEQVKSLTKRLKQGENTIKSIVNTLAVPAVRGRAVDEIDLVLSQLDDQLFRRLNKPTIMGISRLLIETKHDEAAARILAKYIDPRKLDRLLYFMEPLSELSRLGALPTGPLKEFCSDFGPPTRVYPIALKHLKTAYRAVDDADGRIFQRFVIEPLDALIQNHRNLMDIRFSPDERKKLRELIKASVSEGRPLSLLRLGDGEAFPFDVPDIDGIERDVFVQDNARIERSRLGGSASRGAQQARENLKEGFRQAVERCDLLGFPSVYRIIRDLGKTEARYGSRRNQRAFLTLLNALGKEIPIGTKIFTEDRCSRIRGALDESFLVELSAIARSVVLVSSRPALRAKFPSETSVEDIIVPRSKNKLRKNHSEVISRLRDVSTPGSVVIIGAGFMAKILADEARQCGAVALDVGSLVDYMAGEKTRTIADLT